MSNRLSLILAIALLMSLSFIAGQYLSLRPATVSAAPLSVAPLLSVARLPAEPLPQPAAGPLAILPVTPGLFYKTYTGISFVSLDSAAVPQFVSGTGGGVYPVYKGSPSDTVITPYFEVRLDLPQGAQVQEVDFLYHNCELSLLDNHFYFGAYTPESAGFVYYIPETKGGPGNPCTKTTILSPAFGPVPVIDNTQREYVLGWKFGSLENPDVTDPSSIGLLLIGARVGYTIPTTFLPFALKSGATSW